MNKQVDILIVGGGLTGAALMLAVQELGYSTLLVESKSFSDDINPHFDARSLALSPASQHILNKLGLWDYLEAVATPIQKIHVSDKGYFGTSKLLAEPDYPLGYVVEMQYINKALYQMLHAENLMIPATLISLDLKNKQASLSTKSGEITVRTNLLVAADGAESSIRQLCNLPSLNKNYYQQAIVTNVELEKAHEGCAYERFTSQGPLALLPIQSNKMSLVWSLSPEKAKKVLDLPDKTFLSELQWAFGYRLGKFEKVGRRYSYPIKQILMPEQTHWPVVFIGNAAHSLHPIAGQGFNLGLRDVAALAQCIAQTGLEPVMLEDYVKLRRHDQKAITFLTDGLVNLFSNQLPGLGWLRGLGLVAFDNIPALKNVLARYARGFGGIIPDLVCGIALESRKIYEQ